MLVTIALASMTAPLNSTMIAVALPRLMADFHSGVGAAEWLVTSYLVVMAVLQPVAGKVGDRLGRRVPLLVSLGAFGLASAGAAAAPSMAALFVLRGLQAAAGAVAMPNGAALLREIVPAGRRGARFGVLSAATSLAAAAGPPLGGLIVGAFGWRAMFALNVLIIVPALAVGWACLPRGTRRAGAPFDLVGALGLTAVLGGLALWLNRLRFGFHTWLVAAGAAVIAAAAAFVRLELGRPDPVLQPRFFAIRSYASATGAIAFSNLAFYTTLLALPLLLTRQGWSTSSVGLLLTALSGSSVLAAPLGGRLADRLGRRWPAVVGLALVTAGLAPLLWGLRAEVLVPCLMAAGAGLGVYGPGAQAAALEAVGPRQSGSAAGLYSTSRYLGSIVGSSLLAGLTALPHGAGGLDPTFVPIVVAAALSVVCATGLAGRPVEERPSVAAAEAAG